MSAIKRLIHRLNTTTYYSDTPYARTNNKSTEHIHSILESLIRLLNTRKGTVPMDNGYGIDNLYTVDIIPLDESLQSFQQELIEAITRYEQRITIIELHPLEHEDRKPHITFQLEASLVHSPQERIYLILNFNRKGMVTVYES